MDFLDYLALQKMNPNISQDPSMSGLAEMMGTNGIAFPDSGLKLMQITKSMKVPAPSSQQSELQKKWEALQTDSLQQQKKGIADLEKKLGTTNEISPIVAALSAASDLFTGGNLTQGIMNSQQQQQKLSELNAEKLQGARNALTQRESDILKAQMDAEARNQKAASDEARWKILAGIKSEQAQKDNPFEKKLQENLGTYTSEWMTKDRPQLESNLGSVQHAIGLFENNEVETGPKLGVIGEFGMKMYSPKTMEAKQSIDEAVISTLKPTLGAQFTENEGAQIKALKFDLRQTPEENLRRAQKLQDYMQKKIQFTDDLTNWLKMHQGSDKGFPYDKYGMRAVSASPQGYTESWGAETQQAPEVKEWQGKKFKKQGNAWVEVK